MSEDAAQKRVARALQKLAQIFRSQGVAVTVATLASALSTQAVQAAPAELATALAAHALTQATATASLAGSVLKPLFIMARLNAPSIGATFAVLACLSVGTGGYLVGRTTTARHRAAVEWQSAMTASAVSEPAHMAPGSQQMGAAAGAAASRPAAASL